MIRRNVRHAKALALVLWLGLEHSAHAESSEDQTERATASASVKKVGGAHSTGFALRTLGVRGSTTRVVTGDASRTTGGGDFYERGAGVLRVDAWSGRYFDELWIGGGSDGFRYSLAGQLGFGGIWTITEEHGIFGRFAMRGHMRREGEVYSSELRLPGGEVGYDWTSGWKQLELLAHGGSTLTGRYNPPGGRRVLDGFTYGGSLSLGLRHLRLDADWSRIAFNASAGAVDEVAGHLCALGRPKRLGETAIGKSRRPPPPSWVICFDVRHQEGRVESLEGAENGSPGAESSPNEDARSTSLGLSISLGEFAFL